MNILMIVFFPIHVFSHIWEWENQLWIAGVISVSLDVTLELLIFTQLFSHRAPLLAHTAWC